MNKQIKLVMNSFPELQYCDENKSFTGELLISPNDSYDVRISIKDFPRCFPDVYEVGERIPIKVDRHIYESSGKCCLTTRAKEQILLKTKVKNLLDFIELIVIPFFQNNSYYEINKKYKEGEYSHGETGIMESYKDILQLKSLSSVKSALEFLLSGKIGRNRSCYCGSTITLKKCNHGIHYKCYKEFNLIDDEIVSYDLFKLINPYLRERELIRRSFGIVK